MDNIGLVNYAKKALKEKWGYVWGTFGQILTPSLLLQKKNQYPEGVGNYLDFIKSNWLNKKVTDCVGLIKGYYWTEDEKLKYSGVTDVSADTMYSLATNKGSIETMPEMIGLCVWKRGHIGVYIGGGEVIEAHGTKYGVIKTSLKNSTPWTHWLECPYIKYTADSVKPSIDINKKVTASVLNVRNSPEVKANNIIGRLNNGDKVKIFKVLSNGWVEIYFGDHGGFVSSEYLK